MTKVGEKNKKSPETARLRENMYLLSQRNIGEYRIVIRHLCEAVI